MDAFLIIGGSAWQDHGNNLSWYIWREKVVRDMKARGCPVLAIGNNIGPVETNEGKDLFVGMLRRFDSVVVRDQFSFDWIEKYVGFGRANLGSDLVLNYKIPDIQKISGLVGISVHRSVISPEKNEKYINNILKLIKMIKKEDDSLNFRIFSFDGITENDEILADLILNELKWPEWITKCSYAGDARAFLELFAACDRIFASRFHAVILSLMLETPFIAFDYMGKSRNLLLDLNYSGYIITHDSFENMIEKCAQAILSPKIMIDIDDLNAMKKRSNDGFLALDQVIKKNINKLSIKKGFINLLYGNNFQFGA